MNMHWIGRGVVGIVAVAILVAVGCLSTTPEISVDASLKTSTSRAELEKANPLADLPQPPLGIPGNLAELEDPPTPAGVRLGRWLFFDPRMSSDGTVSCATCHRPENGFSEPTPVSTGVAGQKGNRKAPPVLNAAFAIEPHQFWDGRAASLEEQAKGPIVNPIEMGMPDHEVVVERIRGIASYAPFFAEAFGDSDVTIDRIAEAIADYERTRLSGNSPWDRWQAEPDTEDADIDIDRATDLEGNVRLDQIEFKDGRHVSADVKLGHYVFFEKAFCNQCHLGPNFTDAQFHNLGVGWDPERSEFRDPGRFQASEEDADRGAFKTPTLREVSLRAPYLHDGSARTLREVVELYARGGEANPWLSPKLTNVDLSDEEIDALVAFMEALEGTGYEDTSPEVFPQ